MSPLRSGRGVRATVPVSRVVRRPGPDASDPCRRLPEGFPALALDQVFNGVVLGYVVFERGRAVDFVHLYVNAGHRRITHLRNVVGRRLCELLPEFPVTNPEVLAALGRVAGGGNAETFEMFVPGLGEWYGVALSCPRPGQVLAVFDILTGAKRREGELRQALDSLKLAQRAAGAGIWTWNMVSGDLSWSDDFFRLFGLDPRRERASVELWRSVVHPEDLAAAEARVEEAVVSGTLANEHRLRLPDGQVRWIAVQGATSYDTAGNPVAMRGICIDITARKAAEEAERHALERVKELAAKQFVAIEEERKTLSQELHDEVGQSLAALQFTLESLRRKLAGLPAALSDLRAANAIAADLVAFTKDVSRRLRPPILDDLGLAASLRWHLGQLSGGGPPRLRLEQSVGSRRFRPQVELAAFRTVQEALTNVLRHAHASVVVVGVWMEGGALMLCIQDDGVGFDCREAEERSRKLTALGLLGMRERAAGAGGELRIESAPGAGTAVTLRFAEPGAVI